MRHKLISVILFIFALSLENKRFTCFAEDLSFTSIFSNGEYYSNRRFNDLLYDQRGYLWLGSIDGLLRYDGAIFKSYKSIDLHTESSAISCLFEDSKGNVWIGTEAGLCKYDLKTDSFVPIQTKDGFDVNIDTKVGCIREDDNGLIWFSLKSKGIWSYNPETNDFHYYLYDTKDSTSEAPKINSFVIDANGTFFISLYCGGMIVCRDNFSYLESLSVSGFDFSDDNFSQVILGDMNRLFVNSVKYGFCELFPYASKAEVIIPLSDDIHTTCVSGDNEGNIFLSTSKGLYVWNQKSFEQNFYSLQNTTGLYSDNFSCVFSDDSGGIIVGLSGGGLFYSSQTPAFISRYDKLCDGSPLLHSEIKCFSEDLNGDIWVLSKESGVLKLDKTSNSLYSMHFDGISDKCSYLFCAGDTLWLSSRASLFAVNLKNGRTREFSSVSLDANSLIDRSIFPIVRTDRGILFGTALGIITYDEKSHNFEHLPGLEECNVSGIFQDGDTLLVSTFAHGLVFYDLVNKKVIHHDFEKKLSKVTGRRIYGALKDDLGRIWVATSESGVAIVSPDGSINVLNTKNTFGTLTSDNIKSLQKDHSGSIWLTTENGLTHINSGMDKMERYSEIDGLLSDSFLLLSGFVASDGTLYFGSVDGFVSFCPELKKQIINKIPELYIDDMLVNGETIQSVLGSKLSDSIDSEERISLRFDQNSLAFHFSRPALPSSSSGYIMCKMDGLDKEWIRLDQDNIFTCREMPYGRYKLLVRSYSNMGDLEKEHRPLEIRIRPPFYKSVPAIVLYILAFLSLVIVLGIKLIKKFKREEEERYRRFTEEQLALTPQREMLRAAQLGKSPSSCFRSDLSESERNFISKLEIVMDKHLSDEKLSYTMIAEHLCIGKQTLNLKMKSMLGITVNNYILLFRLFAAVALLSEDDSRVNVVCYKVGFNTPSYFAKCFKNAFGMLPGEFKEM